MLENCIICHTRSNIYGERSEKGCNDKQEGRLRTFFKLLERHLADNNIPGPGNGNDVETRRVNLPFEDVINTGVVSCGGCSKVVQSFCDLYHQMKSIELLLNWKLKELENRMRTAPSLPASGKQDQGSLGLVLDFKEGLLEQCNRKLQGTYPRVVLQDMAMGNQQAILPEDAVSRYLQIDLKHEPISTIVKIENLEAIPTDGPTYEDYYDEGAELESENSPGPLEFYQDPRTTNVNSAAGRKKKVPITSHSHSPLITSPSTAVIPQSQLNSETGRRKCPLCPKLFNHERDYRVHCKNIHLKIRYGCTQCGEEFTYRRSYNLHFQKVHLGVRFQCTSCNRTFRSNYYLKEHQRNIKSCMSRAKKKKPEENLVKNTKKPKPDDDGDGPTHKNYGNEAADLKSENFPGCYDLDQEREHSAINMPLEGKKKVTIQEVPSPILKSSSEAVIPQSQLNSETGKRKCCDCPKQFNHEKDYRVHYKNIHLNIRYGCTHCGEDFTYRSSYNLHYQEVHLGVRFQCTNCNRTFRSNYHLKEHQRKQKMCAKKPEENPVKNSDKCKSDDVGTTYKNYGDDDDAEDLKSENFPGSPDLDQEREDSATRMPVEEEKKATVRVPSPTIKSSSEVVIPQSHLIPETGKRKCCDCPKQFNQEKDYRVHYKSIHLKIRYGCTQCELDFPYRNAYYMHYQKVHLGVRFQCTSCDRTFRSNFYLKEHKRSIKLCAKKKKSEEILVKNPDKNKSDDDRPTYKNDGNDAADLKSENFSATRDLDKEREESAIMIPVEEKKEVTAQVPSPIIKSSSEVVIPQSHLNPATGKRKCCDCPKQFNHEKDYRVHYKNIHLKIRYGCSKCVLEFPYRSAYYMHYHSAHLGVRFKCNGCKKSFLTNQNLNKHKQQFCAKERERNPEKATDKHKCDLCDKEFLSANNYHRHYQSIHLGIKWECEVCHKLFATRMNLSLHRRIKHTGFGRRPRLKPKMRKYVCEQCGKSFLGNFWLQVHLRTVHLKEKEHACDQCERRFGTSGNLRKHIKHVHLKVKEHTCEICGKGFARKTELQVHLNTAHWKLRDHTCHICGKGFMTAKVLKGHVEAVHQEASHECDICGKKLTRKEGLKKHKRKIHSSDNVVVGQ